MHQVDVNWRHRFLPLVELLPLPSLPLSLSLSLPLFQNKCHIPAISYLLCWQPQWPVEDSPLQPVHSRRRPVYTALIGSALHCPCDLSPPLSLFYFFLFYTPILSWPLSAPPSVVLAPSQPTPPWFSEAPTVGRGAALLCGSPGRGDVNQSWFLQAFLKWAQGPWWVSVVAGPDLQLIHREEVTFVLLIETQFQHSKLPRLKGIQNLTNVSISFKWKIKRTEKLLLSLRSMMTAWYMWTLMEHLIN